VTTLIAVSLASSGCRDARSPAHAPTVVVSYAGSLAHPFAAALDEYTRRTGVRVVTQSAGSLEAARRITELGDVPDLIALADEDVFASLLVPVHVASYTIFARNRMVIAYTPSSRHANALDSASWWRTLSQPDVEVGRSDPSLDPNGYRALLVLRLAERQYAEPGLEQAVLARSPARNVRPKSSDLVALLQAGALDYAFAYESVARSAGLRWLALPPSIDLGDEAYAAEYKRVAVRIPGAAPGDSITVRGAPIHYALAVPRRAPHPVEGERLRDFLLSGVGRVLLTKGGLDVGESTLRMGHPDSAQHHDSSPPERVLSPDVRRTVERKVGVPRP
jgi:molybdate/tungstate transport system substrate-binding protein